MQPGQPFLLFVKAWLETQRGEIKEREVVKLLKSVARIGTGELLQAIAEKPFGNLDDGQLYSTVCSRSLSRAGRWTIGTI